MMKVSAAWREAVARLVGVGGVRAATLVAGAASTFGLAPILGADQFGLYSVCLATSVLLAQLAKWGLDGTATRLIPRFEKGSSEPVEVLLWATRTVVARSMVIAVGCLVLGLLLRRVIDNSLVTALGYAGLLAVPTSLAYVGQGVLRGASRPQLAECMEGIAKPLLLLGGVGILALVLERTQFVPAYAVLLAVSIASCASTWFLARNAIGMGAVRAPSTLNTSILKSEALRHGWMNVAQTAFARAPILIAGALLPAATVGQMSIAVRVAELAQFGATSIGVALAPSISRLEHRSQYGEIRSLLRSCLLGAAALAAISVLALYVAGRVALPLLGADFERTLDFLAVLLVGQVVAASLAPVGYFASMLGEQLRSARAHLAVLFAFSPALALSAGAGAPLLFTSSYAAMVTTLNVALLAVVVGHIRRAATR